jgi:hypothetical protein
MSGLTDSGSIVDEQEPEHLSIRSDCHYTPQLQLPKKTQTRKTATKTTKKHHEANDRANNIKAIEL